jgi:hypothetical protein
VIAVDQLLIQAKASSAHPHEPAYRRAAFCEARSFLERFDVTTAEGNLRAVANLAGLMLAFDEFSDPASRLLLAQGIIAVVDAIRSERAADFRQRLAAAPPRRHWVDA